MERWLRSDPNIITTTTNRNILQPTKASKKRRASNIKDGLDKSTHRTANKSSDSLETQARDPMMNSMLREESRSSGSVKSGRSQLVDLVVEDTQAEEIERVRARKEGGASWNQDEAKYFM